MSKFEKDQRVEWDAFDDTIVSDPRNPRSSKIVLTGVIGETMGEDAVVIPDDKRFKPTQIKFDHLRPLH
jgi:hypothetical protein